MFVYLLHKINSNNKHTGSDVMIMYKSPPSIFQELPVTIKTDDSYQSRHAATDHINRKLSETK